MVRFSRVFLWESAHKITHSPLHTVPSAVKEIPYTSFRQNSNVTISETFQTVTDFLGVCASPEAIHRFRFVLKRKKSPYGCSLNAFMQSYVLSVQHD